MQLARTAGTVTALDGAPEMIDIAARKLAGYSNVETHCVEIIDTWSPVEENYDAFAAFFFIEHVPDDKLGRLLQRVAKALRPGADIFIAEGAPQRPDAPEVETRKLDERTYCVVERRRTPGELSEAFRQAGMAIGFTATGRFHVGTGRRT